MNLVLDEAEEVHMKTKNRKSLGRMSSSLIFLNMLMFTVHCTVHVSVVMSV